VQHNPDLPNGLHGITRDRSNDDDRPRPDGNFAVYRIVAEDDLGAVHHKINYHGTWSAAMDIFRFNTDGRIVEHWDVIQPVVESSVSGNDQFSTVDVS
jgi:predicted SnoaL-like aldol condensation-catalyzing enzyme